MLYFYFIVFSSDIRFITKVCTLLLIGLGVVSIVISSPNRMARIVSFLYPSQDVYNTGYQLSQSYDIIAQGGFFGNGIGSTMLNALSLPYFYNDFVFSIIVSEVGLLGVVMLILLFSMLFYYSYKVCYILYYKNRFYFYVIFSSSSFIVFSMLGHIAVAVGLIPTAGLNLPFYSTGGSSLLTTLLLYGFILKGAFIADNKNNFRVQHRDNAFFAQSGHVMQHVDAVSTQPRMQHRDVP